MAIDGPTAAALRRETLTSTPVGGADAAKSGMPLDGRAVRAEASMAVNAGELARELEELIAALDRRVPRVEQAGEAAIARDAAALRAKAFDRLSRLVNNPTVGPEPDRDDPA